ncbi:orotate phosphoribosyltransferase, partial [Escherichia coli]
MSSCTPRASAFCLASQSKKPLLAAERTPLRLAVMKRIGGLAGRASGQYRSAAKAQH